MNLKIMTLFLFFFSIISCKAEDIDPLQIIKKEMAEFNIIQILEGNFLDKEEISYLVLSENPEWAYDQNKISIHDSRILSINSKGEIEKNIEFNFGTSEYNDYAKPLIENIEQNIPNWHGYTATYDFNNNGIDEIFSISLIGVGIDFTIYEYNGESIEYVLDDSQFLGIYIENITYVKDKDFGFIINRIKRDINKEKVNIENVYLWDVEENRYILSN